MYLYELTFGLISIQDKESHSFSSALSQNKCDLYIHFVIMSLNPGTQFSFYCSLFLLFFRFKNITFVGEK